MKKVYALLLALVLVLTGCAGKEKVKDVSVKDALCSYKIDHKNKDLEITLRDDSKIGVLWTTQILPEGICEMTQQNKNDQTARFQVTGVAEGAAKLTFTALQNEEVRFALTVLVNVDSDCKVTLGDYRHQESQMVSVEESGLNYQWNVDADGVLNFTFINTQDAWSVENSGTGVCEIIDTMGMPSGCQFSAVANASGQASVTLVGEMTQRRVVVVMEADENGKLEVTSVQEQ